jgi:hypothetical protein
MFELVFNTLFWPLFVSIIGVGLFLANKVMA